ncbi:MAG TPA: efflux transporter outer membrane subunit [Dokdonella sp.]|uniref:efflux transporter outer membrane subunit n=1 Tax=Dokdonella sp. TaxID=2291710 RepID=UPI002C3D49C8|nr:efflux transporter outer membrane subunit [Dokdonella sp.]HUD40880.1 efflux transporter outer membrane subunit [Dokdonella sp.]
MSVQATADPAAAAPRGTAARHGRRLAALVAGLGVVLGGCASLAPHEPLPAAPVPASWTQTAPADDGQPAAALAWRDYFTDPVLRQLIDTALAHNRDLRLAVLRADQARAAFRIQRADALPGLGLGAQAARARVPGDLNLSGVSAVGGEYRAEVGLSSWELDLWGRVRSLNEAALQQWLSGEAGRRAAELALITQVAAGYVGLRESDERVALARRTLATRQEALRIFSRREAVGSASRLELTQVQALLSQAQVLLAQLEQTRAGRRHALEQLVGAPSGVLPAAAPFDQTPALAELAPGLPSALLTARPDIVAAEHRLRAAEADIGAARAAFFPRIALTGSWGSASAELDGLFESGSRAWTFVPTLSLPIFDGGRRRAHLDLARLRRDGAVAEYEQSIQAAFREVADALAARHWLAEQRDALREALAAARERARLARLRYENGSAAYLEVLDAERDLLTAEQQLVQALGALQSSQIALYSALGGGSQAAASASTR